MAFTPRQSSQAGSRKEDMNYHEFNPKQSRGPESILVSPKLQSTQAQPCATLRHERNTSGRKAARHKLKKKSPKAQKLLRSCFLLAQRGTDSYKSRQFAGAAAAQGLLKMAQGSRQSPFGMACSIHQSLSSFWLSCRAASNTWLFPLEVFGLVWNLFLAFAVPPS